MGTVLESIGQRIQAARKAKRLSQQELATATGVHKQTVSRWENDHQLPEASQFAALARTLEIEEAWLRYGDDVVSQRSASRGAEDHVPAYATLGAPIPVRERVLEFVRIMTRAGLPRDDIERYERIIVDARYGKHYKASGRERSEEEWLMDVEAGWAGVREHLRQQGLNL